MPAPALLARGPWSPDQVTSRWLKEHYEPPEDVAAAADEAIAALRRPRLAEPRRAQRATRRIRLDEDGAASRAAAGALVAAADRGRAPTASPPCASVRDEDGRWLAGRRAAWLASWAGRWALGAGGAVDVGEAPVDTLLRELHGGVGARCRASLRCEALVRAPERHRAARRPGDACPPTPRSSTTPSTTTTPGGRRRSTSWPHRGRRAAAPDGLVAGRRVTLLTFRNLKWASYAHSCVYAALLLVGVVLDRRGHADVLLGLRARARLDRPVARVASRPCAAA